MPSWRLMPEGAGRRNLPVFAKNPRLRRAWRRPDGRVRPRGLIWALLSRGERKSDLERTEPGFLRKPRGAAAGRRSSSRRLEARPVLRPGGADPLRLFDD